MNFSRLHCRKNFRLGYFDAFRLLYGLYGEKYYIDRTLSEEDAFGLLCDVVPMSLEKEPESLRALHREVLRFSKGVSSKGDYYDVLIAHAEALAEVRKISEFKIFTDTELLREVGVM
jgi:NTE family protein